MDKQIYLDPAIGLFVNRYEPDPLDGEYPGIEGDRKKMEILGKALKCYEHARSGKLKIAGLPVHSAVIYRTGKYDRIYPPSGDFLFPDEGVRLFFNDAKTDHVTIRPSGTGNSLRLHVQLHSAVTTDDLIAKKKELRERAKAIVDDVRGLLGAPRE